MNTNSRAFDRIAANPKKAFANPTALKATIQVVAESLFWNAAPSSLEPVALDNANIQINRAFIGPEPAAIFAAGSRRASQDLLNKVAMYAYHATIQWGVLITVDGAVLFNSHWIHEDTWYQLPMVGWNSFQDSHPLFQALTPERIASGELERIAARTRRPERILTPVDELLVDQLDHWRSEALRYSQDTTGLDEALQVLFAQFFVLRSIEDRQLAPKLNRLQSACDEDWNVDIKKLSKIIASARSMVGSDLFDQGISERIPQEVLGNIIKDLYVPRKLPTDSGQYNFAWIDADVLGSTYEKYLSSVLTVAPPSPQLRLFDQPHHEIERVSVRKLGGVYYTPPFLVKYLAEASLRNYQLDRDDQAIPKVADIACGSGSFLVAAFDVLLKQLRKRDPNKNWARELVSTKRIFGIDIDKRAVTMARLSLWLRFAQEPDALPLPRLSKIVVEGDSLDSEFWRKHRRKFDVIVGNPPFIANVSAKSDLSRFEAALGRFDYSYLFLELALTLVSDSGVVGMVMPNRLFRNRDARKLREIIHREADLREVVDFGSTAVFDGAKVYIGTIVAKKRSTQLLTPDQSRRVKAILVRDISSPYMATALLQASSSGQVVQTRQLEAFSIAQPAGSAPWLLVSPATQRSRGQLENSGEPLESIAGVYQGIRTGANDVYLVSAEGGNDSFLARITNGLGEAGVVERQLLHPIVMGSDIQRFGVAESFRYIVYPYRNNSAMSETELQKEYPFTFEYLSQYRGILASRTSLVNSSLKWYELIRKRDQGWLSSPKLITRDLATRTSFAVDPTGDVFLVGGTAVVPADDELLLPLLAFLNSSTVDDFLEVLTPVYQAGFRKIEPQHLLSLSVPSDIIGKGRLFDELAELAQLMILAVQAHDDTEIHRVQFRIDAVVRKALTA